MRHDGSATAIRPLLVLAAVAVAFLAAFGAVYVLTVRTSQGRTLADASLRGALHSKAAVTGTVDTVLDVVSVASLFGAMAVVALIALIRLKRLEGVAAVGILVGANVSTWLLKDVLLARPDLGLSEVGPATLNSLPSGHSTAAFSAVAALLFVLPRRWRPTTATVGGLFAGVTGIATMSAGWHRPGDSAASFLLVGAWTTVAALVVVAVRQRRPLTPADLSAPTPVRWLGAAAAGMLVLGGVLALPLLASSTFEASAVGEWLAFGAGGLLVAGTALGVVAAIVVVLDVMERAVVERAEV